MTRAKAADLTPGKVTMTPATEAPDAARADPGRVAATAQLADPVGLTESRGDPMRDLPNIQHTTQIRAAPFPQSDLAGRVADQLAQAARHLLGGPVDITLNPEELGRVRMHLSPGEAGLTLVVTAERPETLDLMRRHIDLLAQEYRALGYASLDFAFGQQGHAQQEDSPDHGPARHGGEGGADAAETQAMPTGTLPVTTTGMDIRI